MLCFLERHFGDERTIFGDGRFMLLRSLSAEKELAGSVLHEAKTDRSVDRKELAVLLTKVGMRLLGSRSSLAGERVAMMVEPGVSFVASILAIAHAGGCGLVLSPLHPAAESRFFCDDAEVQTILASRSLLEKLGDAGVGREVLVVEDVLDHAGPTPNEVAFPSVTDDAPALQLYTSGTTGKPKGAVLTHRNLETQAALLREAWQVTPQDTLLHALPLHHMHGLVIALFSAFAAGASIRFLPKFDAIAIWEGMADATVFMAVPTMYARLFDAFDRADEATQARWAANAKSLRLATSGSAALPVTLAERWATLTGVIPLERFGMTEIGVGMSNPLETKRVAGSVGFPLPTVETEVLDDERRPASSGELWIRGPSVFTGYWKRVDATREAFREDPHGGAPWFRTGDTVSVDDEGRFRIVGRTSIDILKSGGYKLSALEIEEVLRTHPSIGDAAVVGLPDEAWGERVVAAVTLRDSISNAEKEKALEACATESLRTWGKELLAPYKLPKEVVVLDELPRNAMGKVVKPALKELLLARKPRSAT